MRWGDSYTVQLQKLRASPRARPTSLTAPNAAQGTVAWPVVQGGTSRGGGGVRRPLVPVVGETTKGSSGTFFYVYVVPKLPSLELSNAQMHPGSRDWFLSSGPPVRPRKRNRGHVTLAAEGLTLTLLLGSTVT